MSVDHLRGVKWLNEVERSARDVCRVMNMQDIVVVNEVRELMEMPGCLWLQVDVGGGRWALCDTPIGVNDEYVAASSGGTVGERDGGSVSCRHAPLEAPSLRSVDEELGILVDSSDNDSNLDVDMESSPLWAMTGRRLSLTGGR